MGELFCEFGFVVPGNWNRKDCASGSERFEFVAHRAGAEGFDGTFAVWARWERDQREQNPQRFEQVGGGADGATVVSGSVRAGDCQGGWKMIESLEFWLFQSSEELAGVGGEAFYVPALTFGVERVECEGGFTAAADPAQDG